MSLSFIKSFQNGIALHLDPDAEFDEVLRDVESRFEESRKFFKNAKVALSIEDRPVSAEEEKKIINAINSHSDIDLMCIVGKNEESNRKYVKALKRMEVEQAQNCAKIHVGNIGDGDIIEAENDLSVYGNVELGGAAAAKGDVIVLGFINGQAYAGMEKDESAVIIAMGANPRTISINNIRFTDKIKTGFGKKSKFSPVMFRKTAEKIECVPLEEETLRELIVRKHAKTI